MVLVALLVAVWFCDLMVSGWVVTLWFGFELLVGFWLGLVLGGFGLLKFMAWVWVMFARYFGLWLRVLRFRRCCSWVRVYLRFGFGELLTVR